MLMKTAEDPIRTALLRAAEHIQQYPRAFYYSAVWIPNTSDPNITACALGRIGTYLAPRPWGLDEVAGCLGVSVDSFYQRMNKLEHWWEDRWQRSAKTTARCLRRYANKYHPAMAL